MASPRAVCPLRLAMRRASGASWAPSLRMRPNRPRCRSILHQSDRRTARIGDHCDLAARSVGTWVDQDLAAKLHGLCHRGADVFDPHEVEPVRMAMRAAIGERMKAGARVIVARQDHVLAGVLAVLIEHLVTEQRAIARLAVRILGQYRTPDPLAGIGQHVRRIAATGGQHREYRAVGIGKHCLATAHRIVLRFRQYFAAVRLDAALRRRNIAHRDEGQPRRLVLAIGREPTLQKSGYRPAVEQCHGEVFVARGLLKAPAEQCTVEIFGLTEIRVTRSAQITLPGCVSLLAGCDSGAVRRRQLVPR